MIFATEPRARELQEHSPCAMGPRCPPNLTHSSAYLKDNPYELQLGVLKYIRGLLSEVINEATSQVLPDESGRQGDGGDNECSRQDENYLLLAAEAGEGNKLDGQEGDGGGAIVDTSDPTTATDVAGLVDRAGGSMHTAVGRKRPRTATLHGRDAFGVGAVVQCFHTVSDPSIYAT